MHDPAVVAARGPVTITPLRTFPVIRDLVTDVSVNYDWALQVPSFAPPDGLKPGEYRMAQADVDRSQEFRKCIECWLCQDVCHVIRDHEDNKAAYAGPRYFIRHAELDMHPLDARDRRAVLRERQGLGLCNITKCCTEVCPAGIKITDNAIIPMKERSADQRYDPLGRVLRSWRRREDRPRQAERPIEPNEGPGAAEAVRDTTGRGTGDAGRLPQGVPRRGPGDGRTGARGALGHAGAGAAGAGAGPRLAAQRLHLLPGHAQPGRPRPRRAPDPAGHRRRLAGGAVLHRPGAGRAGLVRGADRTAPHRRPDDVYAAVEAEFAPEEIAALTFAIVAINGWNRLAVGLRSDVLSLDGLDLPGARPRVRERLMPAGSFGAAGTLTAGGDTYRIFRLDAVDGAARLPFSLKILLENLLRNEDGHLVTAAQIQALARWDPAAEPSAEIAFTPARVLLQDFTGVPCLVDLAAMREAMAALGGDPARVSPLRPAELIIDHSVIADFFGRPDALARNIELEYRRNAERYAFLRWGQQALPGLRVVPPGTGICHQVNLEHLARVVFAEDGTAFPRHPGRHRLAHPDGQRAGRARLGGRAASRPRRRCSASRCPC